MSPLLRFDQVALRRGGRLLFEDLSFTLEGGGRLQVTGPNGSGKSSLIRLAAGLLGAEHGRVDRSALALQDERLALDAELPLERALRFWARLARSEARVPAALDALGLAALAQVPVRLLSTGQRRRAKLARVAASGAPLWLLDEPLNGLDGDGVARAEALIAAHLRSGGAVLAASHGGWSEAWPQLELGR